VPQAASESGPLQTVTAVASCGTGQRGLDWPGKGHGLFAWCLAEGYSGLADASRNTRVEPSELFDYLKKAMPAAAAQMQAAQTPELFVPNNRPPRAKRPSKEGHSQPGQPSRRVVVLRRRFATRFRTRSKKRPTRRSSPAALRPVAHQGKHREAAIEGLRGSQERPTRSASALQAIAWLHVDKRAYPFAGNALVELIDKVPKPPKITDPYSLDAKSIFLWAGQLRQFMALTTRSHLRRLSRSLAKLDAAVAAHDAEAGRFYDQGRQQSETVAADFDQRIAAAEDEAEAKMLKVQRRLVTPYCSFPLDKFSRKILAGLDQ